MTISDSIAPAFSISADPLCTRSGKSNFPTIEKLKYEKQNHLRRLGAEFNKIPQGVGLSQNARFSRHLLFPCRPPDTSSCCASDGFGAITFSNRASITIRTIQDKFQTVPVLPGEAVTVQLQLPLPFVNTPLALQAMDGGLVSANIAIAADGTGALAFQADVQPGLYRVLLSAPTASVLLQFTVPNPQ